MEFVCIFDGWLGKENYGQQDEVTDIEWSRINIFLHLLNQNYGLQRVYRKTGKVPSWEQSPDPSGEQGLTH